MNDPCFLLFKKDFLISVPVEICAPARHAATMALADTQRMLLASVQNLRLAVGIDALIDPINNTDLCVVSGVYILFWLARTAVQ